MRCTFDDQPVGIQLVENILDRFERVVEADRDDALRHPRSDHAAKPLTPLTVRLVY